MIHRKSKLPVNPHPSQTNLARRAFPDWLRLVLALAIITFAYLYRLDRPLLWADEAQTGIAARNILHFGYPTAFDGRNAAVIDSGRTLDQQLRYKQIPWLHFYVGATSLAIFGNDTAGLRTLFALIGVLAFFPIYAALKARINFPGLLAALVLLAPQTILFQRSARYYSILIFLSAALLWHLSAEFKSQKTRGILAALIFVLLFHTHVAVACGSGVAVLLFAAWFRRKLFWEYAAAVGAGFLSWLVWYQSLGSSLGQATTQLSLLPHEFKHWLAIFSSGLVTTLLDFDLVGGLPIIFWAGWLSWLLWKKCPTLFAFSRDPLFAFIVINVVVQSAASAAVFGYETAYRYSMLRYHAHLVVTLLLLGFLVLNSAVSQQRIFALLALGLVGCNLLTVSFWLKPVERTTAVSWWPPIYAEIFQPRDDAWDKAIEKLRAEPSTVINHDQVILALPPWTQEVALFYLGDRYLVPPLFAPDANAAEAGFHRAVGEATYARLDAKPTWVLDSLDYYAAPSDYEMVARFPASRQRPDDGSRPELTRHAFAGTNSARSVTLYRRRE